MFVPGSLVAHRYRLLHLLGEGGMGTVWAARNEVIRRDVAIKVMLPELSEDPVILDRFFSEAQICGSLRHPGLVDVLDLGKAEDGSPFIVMELLEGESLEVLMDREKQVAPQVILPIIRDVAQTLSLVHKKGIVHRDLKPGNIFLHKLVTGHAVVKVLDFGVSKIITPDGSLKRTRLGTVLGSPAYMSPEQASGVVEVDGRTDVYALGVLLYEALSGRLPLDADNYNALLVNIATVEPPDLSTLVPTLHPELVALVRDALIKDRQRRIPSMDALAERVERVLAAVNRPAESVRPAAESVRPPAAEVSVQKRGSSAAAIAALVGLGLGALVLVVIFLLRSGWVLPKVIDVFDAGAASKPTASAESTASPTASVSSEPTAEMASSTVSAEPSGEPPPMVDASASSSAPVIMATSGAAQCNEKSCFLATADLDPPPLQSLVCLYGADRVGRQTCRMVSRDKQSVMCERIQSVNLTPPITWTVCR